MGFTLSRFIMKGAAEVQSMFTLFPVWTRMIQNSCMVTGPAVVPGHISWPKKGILTVQLGSLGFLCLCLGLKAQLGKRFTSLAMFSTIFPLKGVLGQ